MQKIYSTENIKLVGLEKVGFLMELHLPKKLKRRWNLSFSFAIFYPRPVATGGLFFIAQACAFELFVINYWPEPNKSRSDDDIYQADRLHVQARFSRWKMRR